eukprot:CAMPEP_0171115956 /NCGR_PEP_ID=MMETSP0766_2-20121228/89229_1 /TAXON_ID=439317 /ORGANISM="Gambierdiscus australes, Strain CAWD 149" /LENGTH=73 /DNA_ID=CAMNT_0011578357 /DNA_START=116 /DNA_END=334 /DNA_ORIENTATION=-
MLCLQRNTHSHHCSASQRAGGVRICAAHASVRGLTIKVRPSCAGHPTASDAQGAKTRTANDGRLQRQEPRSAC